MTTEQTDSTRAAGTASSTPTGRVLRRRSTDRVIAGVAGGLGDFLNVDPLLIRIAFVGLMVFGGLGLVLYVGAWLLLPNEERDESIAEQALARLGLSPSRLAAVLLLLIGGVLIIAALNNAIVGSFVPTAAVAFVVIVAGVALLRQGERPMAATSQPVAQPVRPAASTAAAATLPAAPARRREQRPPSPLGEYVLGAMLGAVGLLALATTILGIEADPGQFFGVALGVLGIGLVIGTWWGRARLLILRGLLLLPFAVVASFVTAPIEGGVGDHRFAPANAAELRDAYRLVGGRVVLDLTAVEATGEPILVAVSVALGQLRVILPVDAAIRVDARVGAGDMLVLGTRHAGTALADRYVRDGSEGPAFDLDLETGIGELIVEGGPLGGR
ncbi:MAG: PspC domain-containing protein [Candidatus Limnocylindria bacterium]